MGSMLMVSVLEPDCSVTVVSGPETVSGFGDPLPGVHVTVTVQDGVGTSWVLQQFVPRPPE